MKKIKLLLLLLLSGFLAQAQTPTTYKTGATAGNNFPFNFSPAAGQRVQNLYLPADLTPALVNGGNITRVYFRGTVANAPVELANLNISLGSTANTTYTGTGNLTFYTGLQTCYSNAGTTTLTAAPTIGGWFYIDLTTPFLFSDVTKTLIVEITYTSRVSGGIVLYSSTTSPAAPNHRRLTANSLTATTGTGSTTWTDMGFEIVPPTPCLTPLDQPTALSLTATSSSTATGSFTAAASAPSGYLIVRYPAGATPVSPVDGTAYPVGSTLGTGVIQSYGPSTTINSIGLVTNSTYDYYIYSYNNTLCSGGPKYLTTSPLTGSVTTNGCSSTSGVIPIGPGLPNTAVGGFTSLTNAMAYVNSNGIGGNTIFELQTGYDGTTANETFPITFPYNACIDASKTLTIRPAAGVTGLVITNPALTSNFMVNGANYITFDGRPGGTGSFTSGSNLQIINTGAGSDFELINDVHHINILYCDIMSRDTLAAGVAGKGAINIGSSNILNGNDNITISYCDIHSAVGGNSAVGINSVGAVGAFSNDNISVTNCNIYDHFNPTKSFAGIWVSGGNKLWTITDNKFYQTAPLTVTGNATNYDINIDNTSSTGVGFVVNNNTFGGANNTNTGTYSISGGATSLHNYYSLSMSVSSSDSSHIQGNSFKNISFTSASSSIPSMSSIRVTSGLVNIGTSIPNIIGADVDASVAPSITMTNLSVANGGYTPILANSGNLRVRNNIISGIKLVGSATVNVEFNAISTSNGTILIDNNLIGSLTTPKSIYYATTNSAGNGASRFVGILINTSGAFETCTISNNTINNLYSENSSAGGNNITRGIHALGSLFAGGANAFVITGNTIKNVTSASQATLTGTGAALGGISLGFTNALGSYDVSRNKISNLVSTSPSTTAAIQIIGIASAVVPSSTSNNIAMNLIHSLSLTAANPNAIITGVDAISGTMTYHNNMIRLGIDAAGADITNSMTMYGIIKRSAVNSNFYFNSVYIGGSNVGTAVKHTYAFSRAAAGTDEIQNNIFVNNRSNATTGGKHYQIHLASLSTLTLNYNDYYGIGTGNVFALNNTTDVAAYTLNWVASDGNSKNFNPEYLNPTGNESTVDLHINPATPNPIEGTGVNIPSITVDYDMDIRSTLTPVDMGADAGNFTSSFICSTPNVGGTVSASSTNICENTTSTLTLAGYNFNITGITFQWKVSSTAGGPYVNVTGGTGATTPIYTTGPLANGNHYFVIESTCSNCGPCSILSNEVLVVANTITAPTATNLSICGPGLSTSSVASTVTGLGTGTGQMYWYSAATGNNLVQGPPLQTYYINDFSTNLGIGTITGNAVLAGGSLTIHPNALSQYGSLTIPGGTNASSYQVDFNMTTIGTPTNMADGLSYSFGDDVVSAAETSTNAENGTGSKLRVAFVAYGTGVTGVYLLYNYSQVNPTEPAPTQTAAQGMLAYSADVSWRNTTKAVSIKIDVLGRVTVNLGTTVLFNNVQLPAAYLAANRTTWKHVIKGRSGGIAMGSSIDDLHIQYASNLPGSTTYLTPISSTQTFYVSEKGVNGCFSQRTPVVCTITPLPTVSGVSNPTIVCAGNPVTLNGASPTATNFTWSGGVQNATPFTASSTTTYTVTGSDGTCSSTATVLLTVNPVVSGVASSNQSSVCAGQPITFNASVPLVCAGTSMTGFTGPYAQSNWTLNNSNSNGTATLTPTNITLTRGTNNSGNYGVTVYSIPVTCAGTISFNWNYTLNDVAVLASPQYRINNGASVELNGFNVNSINTPNNQSGTQTITVNAGDVLHLELTTFDNDANVTGNVVFSNFVAPSAPISGSATFYDAATGGANLGASPLTVSPSTAGPLTYYAAFIAAGTGCQNVNRVPVTITVNPLPALVISAVDDILCLGESTNITASGADTYGWMPGTLTGNSQTVTPGSTLTYTVTGTETTNNCSASITKLITVNPLPTVSASASAAAICAGNSATLTGGGADTYDWMPGTLTGSPVVSPANTQIYTVTGTDANSCSATSTVQVQVNALPVIGVTASSATICVGDQTTLDATGASTYDWMPGTLTGASVNVAPSANETYVVTGTDGNNCSASTSILINVNQLPIVTANATVTSTCANTSVILTGGGASFYTWTGGAIDGQPLTITANNNYIVTGTDASSCSNTASISINMNTASGNLSNATPTNIVSTPGTSSGSNNQGASTFNSYYSGSCDLIASINSIGGSLGLTTSEVEVIDITTNPYPTHNGQPFVPRWFQITPANNLPAIITFYLTQDDFNDYNTYATANGWLLLPTNPTDASGIANLRITKNDNTGLGNNPIVLTPAITDIVWNATTLYWEVTVLSPGFSEFRFHTVNGASNAPLPVSLLEFNGQKLESGNLINWATSSELNNAYFNLQHSTDAISYETIAKVSSKAISGNSQERLNYSFTHTNPKMGHNYYRLSQVDIDGKSTLQDKVIDILWSSNGNTANLYPNPISDVLNIELYVTKATNSTIKLFDMSGRLVKQVQSKSVQGLNLVKIDLSDVATGLYSVQIFENDQLSHVSKVSKR